MSILLVDRPWDRTELGRCNDLPPEFPGPMGDPTGAVDGGPAQRRLAFSGQEDAALYLRQFLHRPEVMVQLRALLSAEAGPVWRLGDHDVVDQCAAALMHGRLCVVRTQTVVAPSRRAASAAGPREVAAGVSRRPAPAPPPEAPPPAPEVNPLDALDHDRQAEVLESAARDGVPFCEECQKAARRAALEAA